MPSNKEEFSISVLTMLDNNVEELTVLEVIEKLRVEYGYERKQIKKLLTNNVLEMIRVECEDLNLLSKSGDGNIKGFFL